MNDENYCKKTKNPKPCRKNLGIKRINMPQINTPFDYKKLKDIVKNKLKLKSEEKNIIVRDNIYASQKEINISRAEDIIQKIITPQKKTRRKSKKQIPVILLKDKKNFLVFDGHHRWLAYYLLNNKKKNKHKNKTNKSYLHYKMPSYIIHIEDITTGFETLNNILLKDKHIFHKRHTFKNRNK